MRDEALETLREVAIDFLGTCCAKCGTDCAHQLGLLHMDHIFPKSIWPNRRYDPDNMQILCADCNRDKGTNSNDYRIEKHVQVGFQQSFRAAYINKLADIIQTQKGLLILAKNLDAIKTKK